jgi:CheY-like chemotaxis protein
VSQLFLRADELSNVIYDVKLFIREWKVLFAVDGEMDSEQLSDFLEIENEEVNKALQKLHELRLIKALSVEGVDDKEEITSEETKTDISDLIDTVTTDQEIEDIKEEASELAVELEHEVEKEEEDIDLSDEAIIEEEVEATEEDEFELPIEDMEEQVEPNDELLEFPKAEEISDDLEDKLDLKESEQKAGEDQEDLDDLINDLLQEEDEEKVEDEVESPPETLDEKEEKTETETISDEAVISEKEEDFDLGEIFETDLDETEQSLDDMFDSIETEEEEVDLQEGTGEVLPPKSEEAQKIILVVDDSVVIRKMVEIALENENYNIVSVATGKDALAFLDENEPNMVILDIMLPDVNGLDVLKAIRASKDIPVVMLSAKDTPRETSKAKELGADDFIPKPFKDEELISKIHELIGE